MTADYVITGSWEFDKLSVTSLTNTTTSFIVYYDDISKEFSYGSAPSGSGWSTIGDTGLIGGILGVLDDQDWSIQRNGDLLAYFTSGNSYLDVTGVAQLYTVNCTEINLGNTGSCNLYLRGVDMQVEAAQMRWDTSFGGTQIGIGNINCPLIVMGNSSNCNVNILAPTLHLNTSVKLRITLPTMPGINNMPLLIDTDGTVHI